MRLLILISILFLASCATQYGSFKKEFYVGMLESEVNEKLKRYHYKYYTCKEALETQNLPKIECTNQDSIGVYRGKTNDGSYILGMGSSDVIFEIEVNVNKAVTEIRSDYVYTFL